MGHCSLHGWQKGSLKVRYLNLPVSTDRHRQPARMLEARTGGRPRGKQTSQPGASPSSFGVRTAMFSATTPFKGSPACRTYHLYRSIPLVRSLFCIRTTAIQTFQPACRRADICATKGTPPSGAAASSFFCWAREVPIGAKCTSRFCPSRQVIDVANIFSALRAHHKPRPSLKSFTLGARRKLNGKSKA